MAPKKQVVTDASYCLLFFRVNLTETNPNKEELMNIYDDYVKWRGWDILQSSAGEHLESGHDTGPHIHIHAVVKPKTIVKTYKTGERYPFKDIYLKKNNLKIEGYCITVKNPEVEEGDTDIVSAVNRFLRYPLKEGLALHTHCLNIDTQTMMITAQAHYQLVLEARKKKELKGDQEKLRWNKICNHLDDSKVTTYEECFAELARYTREENPPVTLDFLSKKSIAFLYSRHKISEYELMMTQAFQSRWLIEHQKPKVPRVPPLTEYDLGDCSNEQIKLIKQALSGNYNI